MSNERKECVHGHVAMLLTRHVRSVARTWPPTLLAKAREGWGTLRTGGASEIKNQSLGQPP
jgi:hypothetical protein